MPLSSEVVRQRPLSGPELSEVIVGDLRDLLSRDGMFAPHIGYGRVAYRLRVELEMDNLSYPSHVASRTSKSRKEEEQVVGFPLQAPKGKVRASDVERARKVESPNGTRIEKGLPIVVQRASAGKILNEDLKYSSEGLPPQPQPEDLDRSQEAQASLQSRVQEEEGGGE